MNTAVRYYSRSGHTKAVADAIAAAAGVAAVSVDSADAAITEPVDVLFIGGALYAYGLDSHLKGYLASLKKENVRKAVVFSTSMISKHSVDLIKKGLKAQGIPAEDEFFYARSAPGKEQLEQAKAFAERFL
ncbi:MAG: flavodoxin [Lachnospiraceae bacterium]|nr:flavodoxin [Lachnospiraceae bacterium]